MRKLSKMEIRDYSRSLLPILENHEVDGIRDARIVDAIVSYAFKGLKPWYKRASALQGFPAPSFNPLRVIEGYLIYPIPGLNPVVIQSSALGNAYLFVDIIGAGGGGGGGASGTYTTTSGYGQGGAGGGDGGRLIVMTQGPIPSGSQFTPAFGGSGGSGGSFNITSGCNTGGNGSSGGNAQVVLANGTITISVPGQSAVTTPTPPTGQCAGGAGGAGGSAIFTYLSNTSIFSTVQIPPRSTPNANSASILNGGYGGNGVGSEYFNMTNALPIFITNPLGSTVGGGGPGNVSSAYAGGNGQSATVNVPSGAIPLRGSGGGGGAGQNSNVSDTVGGYGGNGGLGVPGPIIILVIE